jgi:ribosomal protein S18 acetylase RimI-like enzyme
MMLKGIARGRRDRDTGEDVRNLTPADVDKLAIRNHPRLREGDAEALVIQAPGLSKWHPESGEFVIVTPWRHRREIPSISVNSSFRHEDALISAVLTSAEEQGAAAFVLLEAFETRRPSFYESHGLSRIEQIVTYEHAQPRSFLRSIKDRRQEFVQLSRANGALGEHILEIDHAAFPWLWWNSAEEFSSYLMLPNTEVWAGKIGGEVVSYVGFTHYRHWSHLDRIAIRPDVQRMGYGREALHFAAERMVDHGAMQVALSTQGDNAVSRRMYESVGFRATPDHDYDVYGVFFEPGRRFMEQEG